MSTLTIKTNKGFDATATLANLQSAIWYGTGLTYDNDGNITSGIADKVDIYNARGSIQATVQFSTPWDVEKQGVPQTTADLLVGDTVITGRAGNDVLSGSSKTGVHYLTHAEGISTGGIAGGPYDDEAQLTDGMFGDDDWQADNGYGSAYEWIGWQSNDAVINFTFDNSTTVNRVLISFNHNEADGIYLPKKVTINGTDFFLERDEIANKTRGFIPFDGNFGSTVNITLADGNNSRWILADEIEFVSTNNRNNYFRGGNGNDTYIIDSTGNKIIESKDQGIDSVNSSITYKLPNNVEDLTLTGAETLNGLGNLLSNTITGNSAANVLLGFAGNDSLNGGWGNDTLSGGDNTDTDTAIYSGVSSDYKIDYTTKSLTITDTNTSDGDEGVDVLTGVEKIAFSDGYLDSSSDKIFYKKVTPVISTNNSSSPTYYGADYLRALQLNDSTQSTVPIWKDTTIKYYFDKHDDTLSWTNFFGLVDKTAVSSIKKALLYYSAVTPLEFVKTNNPQEAQLKFNLVSQEWMTNETGKNTVVGFMNFPKGNDTDNVWTNDSGTMSLVTSSKWVQGDRPFSTIVHELGHGLGLQHPHFDGGNDLYFPSVDLTNSRTLGLYDLNQGAYTVMSYNRTTNDNAHIIDGTPATPMALDVATLQALYGSDTYRNEDNNYSLTDNSSDWVCIWDTGGTDSIVYSGSKSVQIDLRAATITPDIEVKDSSIGGYPSKVTGVGGGYIIAHGVIIENAIGDSGNDTIMGNDANNKITGGAGGDVLTGGLGNDVFIFNAESDSAVGTLRDVITDFLSGTDKIDLSAIDANDDWSLSDTFDFIGTADFSTAGQLRFANGILAGNTTGNSQAEFEIALTGVTSLSKADFVL